jgi:hypothetical protein
MASDDLPVLELALPGPERDSGIAAILAGEKTAMTGLLQIHEHAAELADGCGGLPGTGDDVVRLIRVGDHLQAGLLVGDSGEAGLNEDPGSGQPRQRRPRR